MSDDDRTSLTKMVLTAISFNEMTKTKPEGNKDTQYVGSSSNPTFSGLLYSFVGVVGFGLVLCGLFDSCCARVKGDGVHPLFEEAKKIVTSRMPPERGSSVDQYYAMANRLFLAKQITVECNSANVFLPAGAVETNEKYVTSHSAGTLLQVYNQETTGMKSPIQVSIYNPNGKNTCYFLIDAALLIQEGAYHNSLAKKDSERPGEMGRQDYKKEPKIGGAH